ncbi:MAG: PAS domain S-box protein, partial [Marinobacter sp.]|nr:PAS domain S-box protein [Marinobacter sp.]
MSTNEPILRVLLIEDDEDDYLITRDLLMEHSPVETRLDWVETVPEGLKALAETGYDAALVDLRLGPDTGLDLIREAGERGINTPFILLTGQGDQELDQRAVEFGAADYLVKNDLDGPTLIRSIRYAIDRAIATENLASSEAHYRILFENNPVPMCLVGQDNDQIHSMNQAARALYGYDQKEVGELTLTDLLNESEKDRSIPTESILLRPNAALQQHRNKDGELLIVEITSRQVAINHHQLQLLMLNDVSDLLEKSRELRLLRRSIESSSTGILICDAQQEDLPLIYVNPAFEVITGY